jgi:glyoxylase-like metal-dependent hydrolase (beta-lactamase superfamily II)
MPTQLNLEIAGYQIKAIRSGVFGLDGGAMFGTVPKTLWEKTNPADEYNRIEMQTRLLLLISPHRKILIDTGMGSDFVQKHGEKLGSKFANLYGVRGETQIFTELARFGVKASDITDVILTHLHFDHAGGATKFDGAKIVPTFENAKYYLQKSNFETATHPNIREKASYLAANWQALVESQKLVLLDGNQENLFPGVSVQVVNGHTQGQQIVWVKDARHAIVYCADLIPMSTHVRLPWVMGYDLRPLDLIEEKRKILTELVAVKGYVYFEHDPSVDAAQVTAERDDFLVVEKFLLN